MKNTEKTANIINKENITNTANIINKTNIKHNINNICIKINNKAVSVENTTVYSAIEKRGFTNGRDISEYNIVLNGFSISSDRKIKDGDEIFIIDKKSLPPKECLEKMMASRHSPGVFEKIKKATVIIFGLGGLGSNIAVLLARTSVGKLILVDFDYVDASNLNRQSYFIEHLGMFKTEAIKSEIEKINPFVEVEIINRKINDENIDEILEKADRENAIVCEAFDSGDLKSMLFEKMCFDFPEMKYVSGTGMAGYESSNRIKTVKFNKNIYICGDQSTEAEEFQGLMAPRVMVCASHQANMILRLILGETEV